MELLRYAVNLALNALYVRIPNRIASSMRVAYVVTKMYSLATNITFSHPDTSCLTDLIQNKVANFHNSVIITDTA